MGKIFYIMGKSSSGKDSIYKAIMADTSLSLKGVVMYSTRPMRPGEIEGKDYFFISRERMFELEKAGKVIERRTYDTVYGPWDYATVEDGQIDLSTGNYLMVGVLSAFVLMKAYYGEENVVPVYVEVEDGLRLTRAIEREKKGKPKYEEMCRRFLTDSADFSEEKLQAAGIKKRYENIDFETCVKEIREDISLLG